MKKILLLFTFIIAFCFYKDVNALEDKIYEGEKIENMWIKKVKGERVEYHQAAVIRRRSDSSYVYCIEPWSTISENTSYSDITDATKLNDEIIKKITTVAYYGYGTINHTDIKWYYITQVAIWKIIDPNAEFYFTDRLNGNKITTYENNIQEVLNLVEKNSKIPDFKNNEITVLLGSMTSLTDINNILQEFDIVPNNNYITAVPIGNTLKIAANKIGQTELNITKIANRFKEVPLIYRHPEKQNFLSAGNISTLTTKLKINVVGGKITINKLDFDTNTTIPSGEATLNDSIFRLYNSKKELVEEKTTIDNKVTFDNLPIGKYYIEEIKAGNGYLLNEDIKEIDLTKENYDLTIDFHNKVIDNVVTIQKLYGKNDNWLNEENANFNIYDSSNKLIKKITTNRKGIIEIKLPYGIYKFVQTSGKDNYNLTESFIVNVNEPNKNIFITKYNEEILGNINILKIDSKTNKPLKNNYATFKVFDYTKNEWLKEEYKTNENGFLSINNLSIGKYKIVEIKSPNGYIISNNEYIVDITKDKTEIYLEIENEKIYSIENTSITLETINIEKIIYEYKKKYFITYHNITTN